MITTDWDNYAKQINGALELTNISKRSLEIYQLLGYVLIFLANGRILDFIRFFWNYRVAAMDLMRKVVFNQKSSRKSRKPSDYEEIVNSQGKMDMKQMIESRKYWKKVQSDEVRYTREMMPQILLEQMPKK